jgi:ornithine cyclodeaminase/alanine dehydrogenase-like protein (mu-crystallin family)
MIMRPLYLTEADVQQLLTMDLALSAVDAAFRKISLDEAVNIPRSRCQTDAAMLHVLPAAAKTLGALGLKAYTTGKFPAHFQVLLFDPKLGHLTAIIEADYLGQVRTGAASGVATKKLARRDAQRIGLYGTGKQARTQLEAVCKVRTISSVSVYSPNEDRRNAFAHEMTARCQVPVTPVADPALAARDQDIVITATTAREPVLLGEWLSPGCHLNIIGSNFLAKSEIDVEVIRRSSLICVDSKDQARGEAGDFVLALEQGVLHWSDVREFAHVLVGRYPGRETPEDITLFKSLGLGIEDVAVAVRLLEFARERGVGVELPIGVS